MLDHLKRVNDLKESLKFTLKWEGGYVNDPEDPGGETKWGISKRAYPNEDIKNLSRERALEIYANDYWLKAGCDELPFPYNAVVFDAAVNCGVTRAQAWLRKSENYKDFMQFRRDHYVSIINKNTNLVKYSKGWWNRMSDLTKFAQINESDQQSSVA
jgi:lysozyme family protein